jgi:hypothetical protein
MTVFGVYLYKMATGTLLFVHFAEKGKKVLKKIVKNYSLF